MEQTEQYLRYNKDIQYEFPWSICDKEILVAAAVRHVNGWTAQGLPMEIHGNIAERNGWFDDYWTCETFVSGWITSHGRFLNREDSYELVHGHRSDTLESRYWRSWNDIVAFSTYDR